MPRSQRKFQLLNPVLIIYFARKGKKSLILSVYRVSYPMREIKVYFDNGDSLETCINGSDETILSYYIGQTFNLGNGENDLMVRAIRVEFLN